MSKKINIYIYGITLGGNPSNNIAFGCCLENIYHGSMFKTDFLTLGKNVTQYQSTMYAALMASHLILNDGWDIVFYSNLENIVKNINKCPDNLKYVAHNELFISMFDILSDKSISIIANYKWLENFTMKKLRQKVLIEGLNYAQ